jgi:predicted Fe-Mo cluster-binding NifX family protein
MMNQVEDISTINKEQEMKAAIITDDGKTISQHFGRATHYLVVTIDDGKETNREMREKLGHGQFSAVGHEEHHGEHHGFDEAAHGKHSQMAGAITDCQVVICGGMGMGAYESMRRLNIQPVVTDITDIEQAIQAYIDGKLVDHIELLH